MAIDVAAGRAQDVRLGFEEPPGEIGPLDLELQGELPDWLSGSLVRVTPARFDAGGRRLRHWFDGQAMLHGFAIGAGRVSYSNRWLRTRQLASIERDGRLAYAEFATDPCRSLFKRVATLFNPRSGLTDNGVVNLVALGDEHLALTETPMPVRFDPQTLETLGLADWADEIPGLVATAHPHGDGGELLNYAVQIGPRSSYRFYAQRPGAGPRVVARLGVSEPAYVHSFGLSERYLVLAEWPYTVNPLALARGTRPFIENFRWRPERGGRLHVFERGSGRLRRSFEAPAAFAFHHVNAFERGDELVVDVCAYEDPSIIQALYLDRLRSDDRSVPTARLVRHRLGMSSGACELEELSAIPFELPRIDYGRRNGRPYRYAYGVSATSPSEFLGSLAKVDTHDGTHLLWREDGAHPGEPVFVRDPDAQAEDAGVALSVVLEPARERSFLLVLDAGTWTELARAELPQHVPFGFHGQFFT